MTATALLRKAFDAYLNLAKSELRPRRAIPSNPVPFELLRNRTVELRHLVDEIELRPEFHELVSLTLQVFPRVTFQGFTREDIEEPEASRWTELQNFFRRSGSYTSVYKGDSINAENMLRELQDQFRNEVVQTRYLAAHPNSHRRYQIASKALLRYFGDTRIDRISKDDVEKFKRWRAKQKKLPQGLKSKKTRKATRQLRPASVNRELALLKHLFTNNEAVVIANPVRKVKFLDEDNEQTRVLTADEERRYLLACSQPLQDIAILMLETGCRPEEIYRIRRQNVHLQEGYLFNPYGKKNLPAAKCRSAIGLPRFLLNA